MSNVGETAVLDSGGYVVKLEGFEEEENRI
jgi:hypothetical protein